MAKQEKNRERICPYREVCQPCDGPRAEYRVLLVTGESIVLRDVVGVELTDAVLRVTPAAGKPVTFAREDVFTAGCAHVAVPVLD